MPASKEAKTTPISIRVTAEEKRRLQEQAGRHSLSDFVRARLFGLDAKPRKVPGVSTNARQLAHILAALGASELAPTLRGLLEAAQAGALPATPETEDAIRAACGATMEIRRDLMRALGLVEGGAP